MTAAARAWLFLLGAIGCEITATVLLGSTDQFTRPLPSVVVICGYVLSFAFLAQALRTLPISLAYAMWSGIGTATVALIGVLLLGEDLSIAKVVGVALIVAGVVVLNVRGAGHSAEAVPARDDLLDEPARRDAS